MTRERSALGVFIVVGLLVAAGGGCAGYQLGAQSLYRPDIRTVHVPVFESDSFRRYLGEQLTEAVVKEIELKTPYKVVGDAGADSVLTGSIVRDSKRPIAENANDEPRQIEVGFLVQVAWRDRRGELITAPAHFWLSPALLGVGQAIQLVPEAGQSVTLAQHEAIARLAEQIVVQMEMPW